MLIFSATVFLERTVLICSTIKLPKAVIKLGFRQGVKTWTWTQHTSAELAPEGKLAYSHNPMIFGTTQNWYQTDFNNSVELIDTFVSLMEKQTEDAVRKYKTEKKTELIEEYCGEDEGMHGQRVETYGGLDSLSWSFETVFGEHFPNLQRRSALLTAYGYFEYEMQKLCILFQRERKLGLMPDDLRGQGIEQCNDYLRKVVGLKLDKNSEEWKAAKRVRVIRNIIVHRDGRLHNSRGQISPEVSDAIANLQFLKAEDEIVLEKGFVSQAVDILKRYFKLVDHSIQSTQ